MTAVERYCKPVTAKEVEQLRKRCRRQAERIVELERRVEMMELIRADLKANAPQALE